jgi:hypothetical protein
MEERERISGSTSKRYPAGDGQVAGIAEDELGGSLHPEKRRPIWHLQHRNNRLVPAVIAARIEPIEVANANPGRSYFDEAKSLAARAGTSEKVIHKSLPLTFHLAEIAVHRYTVASDLHA